MRDRYREVLPCGPRVVRQVEGKGDSMMRGLCVLFFLLGTLSAPAWKLSLPGFWYTVGEEHGNVEGAESKGEAFLLQAFDAYRVIGRGGEAISDESRDVAELIIALPSQLSERPSVQQRRWSDSHVAGVAVGFDTIDHTFTSIHERSFVKLNVGKGSTELILK